MKLRHVDLQTNIASLDGEQPKTILAGAPATPPAVQTPEEPEFSKATTPPTTHKIFDSHPKSIKKGRALSTNGHCQRNLKSISARPLTRSLSKTSVRTLERLLGGFPTVGTALQEIADIEPHQAEILRRLCSKYAIPGAKPRPRQPKGEPTGSNSIVNATVNHAAVDLVSSFSELETLPPAVLAVIGGLVGLDSRVWSTTACASAWEKLFRVNPTLTAQLVLDVTSQAPRGLFWLTNWCFERHLGSFDPEQRRALLGCHSRALEESGVRFSSPGRMLDANAPPKAWMPYRVLCSVQGQPHSFELMFSTAAVEFFRNSRMQLDLDTGLIHIDGQPDRDLLSSSEQLLDRPVCERPPAWRMVSADGRHSVPSRRVEVDANDVGLCFSAKCQEIADYGFCCPGSRGPEPIAVDSTPIPGAAWTPITKEIAPGIELEAATREVAERTERMVDEVLGGALARREQATGLRRDLHVALVALEDAKPGTPGAEGAIARMKLLCGATDPDSWTIQDATNAGTLQLSLLQYERRPTTIVVVPRGKHFIAMPHLEDVRKAGKLADHEDPSNLAACIADSVGYWVFLREEWLDGPDAVFNCHELYHLLESLLLPRAVQQRIDAIYDQTVASYGAFARPYGFERKEFISTQGELFRGVAGPEGIDWLQDKQSDLFGIFRDAAKPQPA